MICMQTTSPQTWTIEHTREVAAPAAAVWQAWVAVDRWPEWNPDIEAITLDGPFAAGSTITMTPRGADPVALTIAEATENASFVDEAALGDTVIRTLHAVEPLDDNRGGRALVTYRLEATGPAAAEMGPAISADFPETLDGLAAHVER
jgi:uncharacterized protein YndB with AHSA1/START domain